MTVSSKICVAGAAGRMGRQIIAAAMDLGHQVSGGTEASGSSDIGADLGRLAGREPIGIVTRSDVGAAAANSDVWIDFTTPAATVAALARLPDLGVKHAVIGTTGFSEQQQSEILQAAERLAIVKAGNFSLGVNLLESLVRIAAEKLGSGWDVEISESHHALKQDAPSGTALMLGEAAAKGRGRDLAALKSAPYDGPEAGRTPGDIGFSVRRLGGVIGDHSVAFGSPLEIVSLSHQALDRKVFAHGAVSAASWVCGKAPGLYNMDDVLGL